MNRRKGDKGSKFLSSHSSEEHNNKNSNVQLETLFNFTHIKPSSLFELALFVAYIPIGLAIFVLRVYWFLVLGVILLILPQFYFPKALLNVLLPLFGFVITIKDGHHLTEKINEESKSKSKEKSTIEFPIIASNHLTSFDVFPFLPVTNVNVLVDKGFFESNFMTKQFNKVCGAIPIDRSKAKESAEVQQEFQKSIEKHAKGSGRPLLFFPEGWDTNGEKGLLLFQRFLFSVGASIQPVAMRSTVPLLPMIKTGVLGSSIIKETLFLFFVPYYKYELVFLPKQNKRDDETPEQFAKRVQVMIANELNIIPTDYSYKDALEMRKKKLASQWVGSSPFKIVNQVLDHVASLRIFVPHFEKRSLR